MSTAVRAIHLALVELSTMAIGEGGGSATNPLTEEEDKGPAPRSHDAGGVPQAQLREYCPTRSCRVILVLATLGPVHISYFSSLHRIEPNSARHIRVEFFTQRSIRFPFLFLRHGTIFGMGGNTISVSSLSFKARSCAAIHFHQRSHFYYGYRTEF